MNWMNRKGRNSIAVIGNGPSLRNFDFSRFSGLDTVGMNAAYRYWREIDWRPTHYACLDDALIETHLDAITELLDEGRIETFFLTGRALELRSELATDNRVRFLDEFVPHWHRVRGASFGLELCDEPAFHTASPDYLTTGAYAVRYACMLGYRNIGLFGIDLYYSDISSAEDAGGNRLIITETPQTNPNYFFDEYQQKGDIYHVPNPDSHEGNLHLEAFRAMRDDFVTNGVSSRIVNTNANSRLASDAIWPFEPTVTFLDEPPLSSVIIPVTAGETAQLISNLKHFNTPSGAPWLSTRPRGLPALVIIFNNDVAAKAQVVISKAFNSLDSVRQAFSGIEFHNLNLSGDSDMYERSNHAKGGNEGLRAGPNNLFFRSMALVSDRSGHALFMETDCIPIRPGWLEAVSNIVKADRDAWVVGSIYRGRDALGPREMRHINGNAIYAAANEAFQSFLNETWKSHLARVRPERPELPFDCVVEDIFQRADARKPDEDEYWHVAQSVAHRMRYSGFIANMAGNPMESATLADMIEHVLDHSPECQIIHSRQLAEAYSSAMENTGCTELRAIINHLRGLDDAAALRQSSGRTNTGVRPRTDRLKAGLKSIARKITGH